MIGKMKKENIGQIKSRYDMCIEFKQISYISAWECIVNKTEVEINNFVELGSKRMYTTVKKGSQNQR